LYRIKLNKIIDDLEKSDKKKSVCHPKG